MSLDTIQNITNIAFFIIIGVFVLMALLSIYIFIKYGRSSSLTILTSMIFGALFILQTIAAFATLKKLF